MNALQIISDLAICRIHALHGLKVLLGRLRPAGGKRPLACGKLRCDEGRRPALFNGIEQRLCVGKPLQRETRIARFCGAHRFGGVGLGFVKFAAAPFICIARFEPLELPIKLRTRARKLRRNQFFTRHRRGRRRGLLLSHQVHGYVAANPVEDGLPVPWQRQKHCRGGHDKKE
jgi:hypothetical protein